MSQMQLAAIGLARWITTAKCGCGYIPILPAGALILIVFLLLRGIYCLCEVWDVVTFALEGCSANGFARSFFLVAGLGDSGAALVGLVGMIARNANMVLLMAVWLVFRVALGALGTFAFFMQDAMRLNFTTVIELVLATCLVALDIQMAFLGVQAFLASTLRWSISPGLQQLVCAAQGLASARGDKLCENRHLLAALLQEDVARQLLEGSRFDTARMEAELGSPRDREGLFQSDDFADCIPLGPDAEDLFKQALRQQSEANDNVLTLDHLLLALCASDEITVKLGESGMLRVDGVARYTVDSQLIKENIAHARRRAEVAKAPRGQVPAAIFGSLPLEETVAAYSAFRAVGGVLSLVGILVAGHGFWEIVAGVRGVDEMRSLRLGGSLLCILFNALGLAAILSHRNARDKVREAACSVGAREDAELGAAFDLIRHDRVADECYVAFRRSAAWIAGLLVWGPAELLLDVPVFGMLLVQSNVCGFYVHGVLRVSSASIVPSGVQVPMHCGMEDIGLLALVAAYFLLKIYMCWAVLALWHQYVYGWTTTDFRGAGYLDPFSPIPEAVICMLAGLPMSLQPRLDDGETQPLLK